MSRDDDDETLPEEVPAWATTLRKRGSRARKVEPTAKHSRAAPEPEREREPEPEPESKPVPLPADTSADTSVNTSAGAGVDAQTDWRDAARDGPTRTAISQRIIMILHSRKSNPDGAWLQKLPDMAKRLENALYKRSASLEEYKDQDTLLVRLQDVANIMRDDIKKDLAAEYAALPWHAAERDEPIRRRVVFQLGMRMYSRPDFRIDEVPDLAQRLEKLFYHKAASLAEYEDDKTFDERIYAMLMEVSEKHAAEMAVIEHRKSVRLCYLQHASQCFAGQECPVEWCAAQKELWRHLSRCSKSDCDVAQCVASRYALAHYHKCKDAACRICYAVRALIKPKSWHEDKSVPITQLRDELARRVMSVLLVAPKWHHACFDKVCRAAVRAEEIVYKSSPTLDEFKTVAKDTDELKKMLCSWQII
jgi:hypothetical protein